MKKAKFHMPTAYTILFLLIILVALSTWFIPSGSYDYVDGVPVAGTYHATQANPQGIGDILKAAFSGFYDAVDVCVFILMVGGFLGVVMKTGAIDAGVSNVIALLGGREKWLIPILMLFFGLGGTTYGMWEETMAFYPLLIPVFLAAGYDAVVGISVILLGAGAGVIASTVNPFATGIAAGFAGVSLGDGILLRLLQWIVFEAAAIWFVMAYAARVKRDPSTSVVGVGAGKLHVSAAETAPLTPRRKVILVIFALVFAGDGGPVPPGARDHGAGRIFGGVPHPRGPCVRITPKHEKCRTPSGAALFCVRGSLKANWRRVGRRQPSSAPTIKKAMVSSRK